MKRYIEEIFETGQFTSSSHEGGKYVQLFEGELTKFLGRPTVTVNSGTSALIAALKSAGLGIGSIVAIPAYSFIATKNAVLSIGAKPYYVDIKEDGTIDLDKLPNAYDAVMVVDLYGKVADIPNTDQPVIEDAAQAFGVPGTGEGDFVCYSFYPTKRINTMEGGAVTCDDPDEIRFFRNHTAPMPYGNSWGLNLRMNEISAAMGYEQITNYIAKPIEIRKYNYTLSPPGQCPNADALLKL